MAHQRINSNPAMTCLLVDDLEVFKQAPVVICDVGARGGIEPHWQVFGNQAQFIGFEPDQIECDRLNQVHGQPMTGGAISEPRQIFYPVALGRQRETRVFSVCRYGGGSSFYPADMDFMQRFPAEHSQQLEVIQTLELETISFDEFAQIESIPSIDFLKLDVEGCELDILQRAEHVLNSGVLGLSLEVLFHDSMRHQPPFHAIDQFLQSQGFRLFDLETYRHARRTLDLPTESLGNTQIGQVLWGQALYLRDAVADALSPEQKTAFDWTPLRILKLAAFMELFILPDCAMELLQTYQPQLESEIGIDVSPLMEQLAAPYQPPNQPTMTATPSASKDAESPKTPSLKKTGTNPRISLEALLPVPKCYAHKPNFLTAEELSDLQAAITNSPYLAKNQLSEGFQDSYGFSIVFTRSGLTQVLKTIPALHPYVERVLKLACNAFYLNLLMLSAGGEVKPHVDGSLGGYPWKPITPTLVSVLYVQVPDDLIGGELVLKLGKRPVAELKPEANTLLYFLGNVMHSVNPAQTSTCRISLVCEQYNLAADDLETIPEFELIWGDVKPSHRPPPSVQTLLSS